MRRPRLSRRAAGLVVIAGLALSALPALARLQLPPGQAPAAAETGGRKLPAAAAHGGPGCARAWPMPFMSWGCPSLDQIEMQTRFDAGLRALILAEQTAFQPPRLPPPGVVRKALRKRSQARD